MADTETALPDRTKRKSVAFSEGTTIVDSNGEVTEVNGNHADSKPDDETAAMFEGLKKKKKSSKSKEKSDEAVVDDDAAVADGEFDPSALKKKKKKKVKAVDTEDFEAKLAEAGATENADEEKPAVDTSASQEGDPNKGTGIWAHENTTPIEYTPLLSRFFNQLHSHHPDLAGAGTKSYKIPPPQCLREGNKKTIFANIAEICKRMKRTDEHVTQFLFAELGTSGSVDGSRRLVIKGRFQQKQIENVLRRYIVEYVTCKTCRSPDTELSKGENRLYFVTCNSCGSRRSVTAIKTGFSAQVGKRKRQQG
ncbi:eukaryotic translation initiation factor 2 beta subunit [Elsinoe ampelina]|uniref:Eukaryotic translation initiation factor 2 beta subunit n=1 Tax=Elsinoe ampelina TaxID=302913 RepID=A0A6A6G822_9PEZI|nr:eukaryotic translation initiation factor 2 beta subunit [Elsinoe ampelina]